MMPFDYGMAMFSIVTFGLGFVLGSEHELKKRRQGRIQNDKRLIRRSK